MRIATSLRSYQISRFVRVIFCRIHFFMSSYDLGMPLPEALAFRFRRATAHRALAYFASSPAARVTDTTTNVKGTMLI